MSEPISLRRIRGLMPAWAQVLLFVGLVVAVGIGSATWFRPPGTALAIWWPVAGIGAAAVSVAEGRQRWVMLVAHLLATGLGNHLGGQPAAIAALLGVANAAQVAIVVAVLQVGRSDARRLHDLADLGRLLLAVIAGAVSVAVMAGVIASTMLGASFAATAFSTAPSHASALLLFLPLVARGLPGATEAGRSELFAQWLLVCGVTTFVFLPGRAAPVSFLVFVPLLWGALRAPLRAVCVQLVSFVTIAAFLTLRAGGPFVERFAGSELVTRTSIVQLQLLLVTAMLVTLSLLVVVGTRRQVVADLRRRDRQLHDAFERSLVGMVRIRLVNGEPIIDESNAPAAQLLGTPVDALVGRSLTSRFATPEATRLADRIGDVMGGQLDAWRGELALEQADRTRWVRVSLTPGGAEDGLAVATAQLLDVTAEHQRLLALTELALRDELTGLANRVLLQDRFAQALADARRHGGRLGVMVLDLDRFKDLNDLHGHAAGDVALREIAERLRRAVREGDTVARLGGDEFVVLLPDLDGPAALAALSARIGAIADDPVLTSHGPVHLGVSVGAVLGSADDEPQALLRRADRRMYAAKRRRAATGAHTRGPASAEAPAPSGGPLDGRTPARACGSG